MSTSSSHPPSRAAKAVAGLTLAAGLAFALSPTAALAQHDHGGGGHSGGGGGHVGHADGGHASGGGWHGGGGLHGGGGGWHGGWGRGWGWGAGLGFGLYNPFWYPGFGWYDPFWAYDIDPEYYQPPVAYAPQQPTYYWPQQPAYSAQPAATPAFYTWPVGVQGGSCNRAYLSNAALGGAETGGTTLGGVAIGPLIRGSVGSRMTVADQACVMQTLELGRDNAPVAWHGNAGIRFEAQPTRTYYHQDGQPCRDYLIRAHAGNRLEETEASACRDSQGNWQPGT